MQQTTPTAYLFGRTFSCNDVVGHNVYTIQYVLSSLNMHTMFYVEHGVPMASCGK